MAIRETSRPLASLITQVMSDLAYLLQTEIRLARAEIGEKISTAANGGMFIGIAAVLFLTGLPILLLAGVRWLEIAGLPNQWGLLLVGGGVVLIGLILALVGANNLKGSALKPDRTIEYEIVKAGSNTNVFEFSEDLGALQGGASQIVIEKHLPLQSLEPGQYTLRVKVVDKKRNQTVTPTATFTVT